MLLAKLRAIPAEYRAVIYRVVVALLGLSFVAQWATTHIGVDVDTLLDALRVVLGLSGTGLAVANTPRA